jgi:hypothetical protein
VRDDDGRVVFHAVDDFLSSRTTEGKTFPRDFKSSLSCYVNLLQALAKNEQSRQRLLFSLFTIFDKTLFDFRFSDRFSKIKKRERRSSPVSDISSSTVASSREADMIVIETEFSSHRDPFTLVTL